MAILQQGYREDFHRSICCRTTGLQSSFTPQTVRLLNSSPSKTDASGYNICFMRLTISSEHLSANCLRQSLSQYHCCVYLSVFAVFLAVGGPTDLQYMLRKPPPLLNWSICLTLVPVANHQSYQAPTTRATAAATWTLLQRDLKQKCSAFSPKLDEENLQRKMFPSWSRDRPTEINLIVQYCLEMNGNLVRVIRKQVAVVSVNISTSSQDITCWWNTICATCVNKVFHCCGVLLHSCFLASFCRLGNILHILGIINLLCAWNQWRVRGAQD